MKLARSLVSFSLILSMMVLSLVVAPVQATQTGGGGDVALQRGYRTGYSDGYMAGYRDSIDKAERNVTRHDEYSKADRAYNADYGRVEDYKDGYRQGFEAGYNTGFDKKAFDASIPAGIARRGMMPASYTKPIEETQSTAATVTEAAVTAPTVSASIPTATVPQATNDSSAITPAQTDTAQTPPTANTTAETTAPAPQNTIRKVAYVASDDPVIIIPKDTEIIVEMTEAIDTERGREGDKFTAKVVSPVEIAGATVEGHIDKVTRPGRIKRRSQLLLQFDRIVISDSRWTNFDAIVTEVLPVKGDNVKRVDDEGTAIGKSSLKGDLTKVGISTGAGAGIGLFGGPVGAAVGAGVGAAFGVGAIMIERGKDIKLKEAQQIRIKTSYESQIR